MATPHTPRSDAHTQSEPTIRERFQELNAASSREASALAAQGKKAGPWGLVFAPPLTFLKWYLGRGEWRHGIAGLVVGLFAAYEVFARYAKLWELHHNQRPSSPHKGGEDARVGVEEDKSA